jgi:hypothetical protein
VSTHVRASRGCGLALAAVVLAATACGGGTGGSDSVTLDRSGPNPGAIPTIAGGVELPSLDPTTVLVGAELTFGTPLPSEQAAADAFTADPEVTAAIARRVFVAADGRHLADVVVLVLDGAELFDEGVLAAFEQAVVGATVDGAVTGVPLAGRTVLRAAGDGGRVAIGFREGDLLTIVTGPTDTEVNLTVSRQLEALGRGEVGAPTPVTPLIPVPLDAAFVVVPTVAFAPIPPPEEEVGPEVPGLPGATALQGRYGVVAGERRTVVWAFTVDPGAYPSAESLDPAMQALAATRAGGTAPAAEELGGSVVYSSLNDAGTSSAQVFRHQGLVLLVEGDRPDQVMAVTTAWISALGPG